MLTEIFNVFVCNSSYKMRKEMESMPIAENAMSGNKDQIIQEQHERILDLEVYLFYTLRLMCSQYITCFSKNRHKLHNL